MEHIESKNSWDSKLQICYICSVGVFSSFKDIQRFVLGQVEMEQSGEEVVAGLVDEIIQLIEEKGAELTQSRKGMLSERKKALSGVEKLHNYTKIGDFKSLNGEGNWVKHFWR